MDLLQEIEKTGYIQLDNVSLENPNKSLEEFISSFAKPISYLDLPMVMDLRPQPGFQPASYAGTGEFDLHTDLTWYQKPPRYIGMYCVRPEGNGGGIPLLADGWKALGLLSEEDVHYLKHESVSFPPPSHIDYPPLTGPIVSEQEGKLEIRFRYDMLVDPAPPIRRYLEAIHDCLIRLNVSPGTVFIFDNSRMLHGRTELQAGLESDRFFKRIYGDDLER